MDNTEAIQRYQEAQALYQTGRLTEALVLLDELNQAFPETREVRLARAMVLSALGRQDESSGVCDQLDAHFPGSGTEDIRTGAAAPQGVDGVPDQAPKLSTPLNRRTMFVVAGGAVLGILLAGIFLFFPCESRHSSPDDSWRLVVSRSGKPWMLKLDGSCGTALADVQLRSEPRIRNGLIVFAAEGPGGRGIYVMSACPNAPLRKLPGTDVFTTPSSGIGTSLAISPDATRIVFSGSNPGDAFGSFSIFVQNVDGTEQRLIHRDDHGHHGHYCWNQPTRILFWRGELFNAYVPRIYAMIPDGQGCTRLTSDYSMWPDVSPDLTTVAYTEDHQGREHLVIADIDFSNPSPVPGATAFEKPRWHPTANAIFALNTNTHDIYRIDAKTGDQERITYWGDVGSVDCGQVSGASCREHY